MRAAGKISTCKRTPTNETKTKCELSIHEKINKNIQAKIFVYFFNKFLLCFLADIISRASWCYLFVYLSHFREKSNWRNNSLMIQQQHTTKSLLWRQQAFNCSKNCYFHSLLFPFLYVFRVYLHSSCRLCCCSMANKTKQNFSTFSSCSRCENFKVFCQSKKYFQFSMVAAAQQKKKVEMHLNVRPVAFIRHWETSKHVLNIQYLSIKGENKSINFKNFNPSRARHVHSKVLSCMESCFQNDEPHPRIVEIFNVFPVHA